MRLPVLLALSLGATLIPSHGASPVTLKSLLSEMTDRDALARFPAPEYQSLQASSYNRASTHRDQPDRSTTGWFADSDGVGFIRTEDHEGHREWVLMEHDGPGCITKIWTPFFYYDLNNHTGPNLRVYLDGSNTPVLNESLIRLVRGEGTFTPPIATPTARAGDSYLPIPFAKHCKVTLTDKSFYFLINYRAYPAGTAVESFSTAGHHAARRHIDQTSRTLTKSASPQTGSSFASDTLAPNRALTLNLAPGSHAIRQFTVRLPEAVTHPEILRQTILSIHFDNDETVWTPIGDFFSNADSLHPFHTYQRTVQSDATMVCRWVMPYQHNATIQLLNLGPRPTPVELRTEIGSWTWDHRSMHFHARWRPDELIPGSPFQDWNFVDIHGRGVYVGDSWTVLNPQEGWWGEGDEKIYIDDAWAKGFPTHFGTGSEDYYGWAGGVNPTRADEFSTPFLANVRVGGLNQDTKGFNICTRTRALDAIPFHQRLVFDMESSFGVDIRHPWDLLGYSAVTYWYAIPGAIHNRPPLPQLAAKPIVSLHQALQRRAEIQKLQKP